MNFRKRQNEASAGFQMAPMLDIVFILLIHFMAATLFAKWENKLEITVPTAGADVAMSRFRREIIINLDKDGDIYINSIKMSDARLAEILRAVRADNASQPVVIRADRDARHKDVIRILDLCTRMDIRNVAFSTIKPDAGQEP